MNLKTYLRILSVDRREDFARHCNCTLQHLKFVAYGAKRCSPDLALAIERESGGAVTVADLRPEFAETLKSAGYVRIPPKDQAA
jgi:DNA-binding transcriptional regulator YdaS (Cro superfamily)